MSREQVLQMLCPGDSTAEWQETLNLEQIGQIGHGFLESPTTRKWMNSSGLQVLWGHGPSGTGKTFISSQIAKHACSTQNHNNLSASAIYFFDNRQPQTNLADFGLPFCSIARQLAAQLPDSSAAILDRVEIDYGFYPVSDDQSKGLFCDIASGFHDIFLVLDGVNASEPAIQAVLDYLRGVCPSERNIHVLITSQKGPPSTLEDAYGISIVEIQAAQDDLRSYVMHEVGLESDSLGCSQGQDIQQAVTGIVELSGGRFPPLLLRNDTSPSALLESLSKLRTSPATEEVTTWCELAVSQARHIHSPLASHVLHILGKLYHLRYPATAAVVTEALKSLDIVREDNSFYTIPDVIGSCPGLIIVSHQDSEMRIKSPLLQSYLCDHSSRGLIDCGLVKSSFKYLCDEGFHSGPCTSSETLKQRFQKHPFLPCAARIISVYMSKVSDPGSIFDDFLQLCSHSNIIESYFQAAEAWPYRDESCYSQLERSEERWRHIPRGYTPLHLATHLVGGRYFIERLLQRGHDIEARTENGLTALHIAAEIEDESGSVQALLEHGADVSALDESGDTPLSMAVSLGNLESVKLLVQYGACVGDLDDDVLVGCADSRPEIADYLAGLGVMIPDVDSENE